MIPDRYKVFYATDICPKCGNDVIVQGFLMAFHRLSGAISKDAIGYYKCSCGSYGWYNEAIEDNAEWGHHFMEHFLRNVN